MTNLGKILQILIDMKFSIQIINQKAYREIPSDMFTRNLEPGEKH